jgi:hypothetical protein
MRLGPQCCRSDSCLSPSLLLLRQRVHNNCVSEFAGIRTHRTVTSTSIIEVPLTNISAGARVLGVALRVKHEVMEVRKVGIYRRCNVEVLRLMVEC